METNKFRYKIMLQVEIEAFDESDAWDAVQDAFGVGDNAGIVVTTCEYREVHAKKSK